MSYDDRKESPNMGVEMITLYKWGIGALTTLVMFFGGFYIDTVADTQKYQTETLLAHEQRITTLEESKRNTEQLLLEIKQALIRISNVVVK